MKLLFILLTLALAKSIILYKVYHSLPAHEIKRRSRSKDTRSVALYKVAAYENTLDFVLWVVGVASAITLFIWAARTNWILATIVIAATIFLLVCKFSAEGWAGGVAAFSAPYHAKFLSFIEPPISRLINILPFIGHSSSHTGLFERKDLLQLINKQNQQPDNRIPESDLEIAFGAITFGDKLVGSIMTPRRKIKFVNADDTIGPLLMDELHKSGFSRFPVIKNSSKSASPEVVGTLYLNDLVGYDGSGKVKELAQKKVYFINEDSNLRRALSAFLKTHHHLLIVVNSFEEVVGVVSLEDVLEQIIGQAILDEFDSYEDLRSVAAKEAEQEQNEHEEIKAQTSDIQVQK